MICSDSLSCLLAIENCKTQNPLILKKNVEIYKSLVASGKHAIFTVSNCFIRYIDFKPFIMKHIFRRWQDSWDQQIYNKLHEIHFLGGRTPCSYGQNRKEQVILARYRIGHSRLTHSYLLNNEERSECIQCNSNDSLRHVLIDCVDVADLPETFDNFNNLFDLFTNVAGDTILKFLKEIEYIYI